MRIAITICALLALVATAGCGGKKTVSAGGTTVTTSDDDKTTTISASGGSMTVGSGAVDASKAGAPLYPGATQEDGGSMTLTTGEGTNSTTVLKSTDSFDKVYDFYKAQMPSGSEKLKMISGGSSTAMFQVGDNDAKETVLVTISAKDGDPTSISINHGVKSDSAMASAAPPAAPSPGPSASSDGGC